MDEALGKDIPASKDPQDSDADEGLLQEIRSDTIALSRAGIARIILDSNKRYDSDAGTVDLDMVHFHIERDLGEPESGIPPSTNIVMFAVYKDGQGEFASQAYGLDKSGILGVPDEMNRLTKEQMRLIDGIADSRPSHPNDGEREVAALNRTLPGNKQSPA